MFSQIYYNKTIRKIITAFGSLFTNTTLVRYNNDGSEQSRMVLKVAFGSKEKYMNMLTGDPQGNRPTQITVPVISFIMNGLSYDNERKGQTTLQNFAMSTNKGLQTQYNAVPYNFDFSVFVYVRTIEDGNQIIEQWLPFLTPDYTLRINLVPSMGITKDVPVILDDVSYNIENEGIEDDISTRLVVWTLNFTVRGWLFGPISSGSIIKEAITNIYIKNDDPSTQGYSSNYLYFVMSNNSANGNVSFGNYRAGEIVYQGNTLAYATATAEVVNWSNLTNRLEVTNPTGTFVTNTSVIGNETGADKTLINYEITPYKVETVTVQPNPLTANLGDDFGFTTTKTFYNGN